MEASIQRPVQSKFPSLSNSPKNCTDSRPTAFCVDRFLQRISKNTKKYPPNKLQLKNNPARISAKIMCEENAVSLKAQGNEEFKKGNFLKAAAIYTKAIKEDPENAVLYSNRCAALLKLSKVSKAMTDAEKCIEIKPDWEKGYFRKASAFEVWEKFPEALEWYKQAAEKNPSSLEVNTKIRNLSKVVKAQAFREANGGGSNFGFPNSKKKAKNSERKESGKGGSKDKEKV